MKRLFYLFTIACSSQILAQISFEPGYIISNSGEKTDVLIKNVEWLDNPTDITLRIPTGEDQNKSVEELLEFGITDGVVYKKKKVKLDLSSLIEID